MANEVRKAKLKMDFENGFTLSPELSAEEALKAVLQALKNGEVSEVKIAVEYNDGSETEYEEEEEEEEEDEDEEEDDEEEE
ncbi:hypothetical protein [Sutcliffiella deserti]|uniref:hypothetical protein n=1 Tax=Sutcliffiella deserti TaxID=2875501 RepID=UPI001CBBC701|nr:hypothetical protein [Sutcliffiella deserti]